MSGGSFDYLNYKISQFADELKYAIKNNKKKDSTGYSPNYSNETILFLNQCHKIIETAGKLANVIDYLYSGDSSEDTFKEEIIPILNKFKKD